MSLVSAQALRDFVASAYAAVGNANHLAPWGGLDMPRRRPWHSKALKPGTDPDLNRGLSRVF